MISTVPGVRTWRGQDVIDAFFDLALEDDLQTQFTVAVMNTDAASVAEISARIRLQLGVTKILVADLCAAGYLEIHRLDASPVHNPDVILRVIHGLRAIS